MHLMLRATDERRDRVHDVIATVEPDHTVDELRRALTQLPGLGHTAVLTRAGRPLDPDLTLDRVGIVSGEELVLAVEDRTFTRVGPDAVVRLDALAGPASGWRVDLTPGTHVLGRTTTVDKDEPDHLGLPDEAVSRNHVRLTVGADGSVVVDENPEATNPLRVDGEQPDGPVTVGVGSRIQVGDSIIAVGTVDRAPTRQLDQLGQIAFHRTPLRPARPPEVELPAIQKIPGVPEPARFSFLTSSAPLLAGILMAVVLKEPRFLIFTMLAPITAVGSYFESKRRNRERHERDVEAFEKRFAEREEKLRDAHGEEERLRHEASPDLADLRRRAERHDHTLWGRGRDIPEFLDLRIGLGTVETNITAPFGTDGDEDLITRLEELDERHRELHDVPITVPLAEHGAFGIHGPRAEVSGLAKALLIQAICLHSPEDLVVAAAASDELDLLDWLRWAPHTRATGSPLGGVHLADDRDGADALLRAVLEVAEFRTVEGGNRNQDRRWPWILLVLDRLVEPGAHLVAQVMDRCPDAGISVLWLSDGPDRIPPRCTAIAAVVDRSTEGSESRSHLWFTDTEIDNRDFSADGVDHGLADTVARALAPLRDASSGTATSSIPRIVPLLTALGVDEVTPALIQQEWAVDRVGEAPYAVETVVGTSADGRMVLDLVSDGPHGLIGGTSGAGKSELIAALVTGLVAYQSPRDLSLMFIDFKGGSASEVFKDLPHISGRVTDLDESLALRAQVSLRAELRRRVALFSDHAAKDMADMRRLHPEAAPPSLVIVIDEFATLVAQLPEFVADIIDIAQRGRSYGVHLILATQRPSSSVDDNILANTNLRISLRMLDRVESMSILNAPDAADIAVPLKGRSIARMGPGQLVEFQSAYCSAPLEIAAGRPPVDIRPLGLLPPGAITVGGGRADDGEEPRTQLDEVIDAIIALDHPPVRRIWNELLPEHLTLERAEAMPGAHERAHEIGRHVLVGGADDPDNQRQLPAVADLADGGGLLVLGTGGSGKTTVLETIAASLTRDVGRAGSPDACFVVLDFSSGELRSLRRLPTCAGVGTLDDLEATTRIIETLAAEVGRRRQLAADAAGGDEDDGAPGSNGALGGTVDRGPNVVLLVDGYPNLVETLENSGTGQEQATDRWLAEFHRIVLDGRQVGIHTVLTADRGAAIRSAVFASVTHRLVLRQVDKAETAGLGIPPTESFGPGAGYLDGLRVQIATIVEPEQESDRALDELARTVDTPPVELLRPRLPELVHRPAPEPGAAVVAPDDPDRWRGTIGIADISGHEIGFDLAGLDMLVTGPPLSGRSSALRSIAERFEDGGRSVFAVGVEDSGLRRFPWRAAAWGHDEIEGLIGTMRAELDYPGREALLVVDDLDLLENPTFDSAVAGLGNDRSIRVVGSTTSFGYSGNEIVKRVRAARQVLHLQPASAREVAETIGVVRLPLLRLGLPMPQGRGMFVRNRVPTVVQTYAPVDPI